MCNSPAKKVYKQSTTTSQLLCLHGVLHSGLGSAKPSNHYRFLPGNYSGYLIHTNRRVVKLLIHDFEQCCEEWGHLSSQDDLNYFVGASICDIYGTDTAMQTTDLQAMVDNSDADLVFLNIKTSRGLLQFYAYTVHNGYYGHNVVVDDGAGAYDISPPDEDTPTHYRNAMRPRQDN